MLNQNSLNSYEQKYDQISVLSNDNDTSFQAYNSFKTTVYISSAIIPNFYHNYKCVKSGYM